MVGWGLGVTVITVGARVLPPITVVDPPRVSISSGLVYVDEPHIIKPPKMVVVLVALTIEVVPPIMLVKKKGPNLG